MAAAIPILGKIAIPLIGGLVGSAVGSKLIGGKKEEAAPPPAPPAAPTVMPVADDEAVMRARRRAIVAQRSRRGRESTMLTPVSQKLGG